MSAPPAPQITMVSPVSNAATSVPIIAMDPINPKKLVAVYTRNYPVIGT